MTVQIDPGEHGTQAIAPYCTCVYDDVLTFDWIWLVRVHWFILT